MDGHGELLNGRDGLRKQRRRMVERARQEIYCERGHGARGRCRDLKTPTNIPPTCRLPSSSCLKTGSYGDIKTCPSPLYLPLLTPLPSLRSILSSFRPVRGRSYPAGYLIHRKEGPGRVMKCERFERGEGKEGGKEPLGLSNQPSIGGLPSHPCMSYGLSIILVPPPLPSCFSRYVMQYLPSTPPLGVMEQMMSYFYLLPPPKTGVFGCGLKLR